VTFVVWRWSVKTDKATPTRSKASKAVEMSVEMLAAGGAGILALFPQTAAAGVALSFAAPLLRTAAGRAWAFQAGRRGERVDEVAEGVRRELTDEEVAGKADRSRKRGRSRG
jgi:hypothetical protein